MTKLDSILPSLTHPAPSRFDRGPTNRLIVLVPAEAGDSLSQFHRIWEIASASGLNVLLLSLCDDPYEESLLRRQLVTMAAMISDSKICAEIRIEPGNDWVQQLKNVYRPSDVIACYAGQQVGLMQKPLHEVLRSQLEATIYILSPDQPIKNSKPKLFSQISFWFGAVAIMSGFLWLEVRLVQLPQDWAHSMLLYTCVLGEMGILLLWNSISTQ